MGSISTNHVSDAHLDRGVRQARYEWPLPRMVCRVLGWQGSLGPWNENAVCDQFEWEVSSFHSHPYHCSVELVA